jgi:Histidine kinase-, DNA gyrase B-, and HSP90-like ATPase
MGALRTRYAPARMDRVDINQAIREVIEITRGEAVKNGASMQTALGEGLPLIHGDRVQLQQVLLNLVLNAMQAMSGVSERARELLISSGKTEPGGVLVAVKDTGPGLAPATLERLFDAPIDWPVPDSEAEDWIFAASALIFVEPTKSERAHTALRQAVGGKRLEYLLALLAFIRTAHYWTTVHPGLKIEDDVRELMSSHKELAHLLLQDPDLADTR